MYRASRHPVSSGTWNATSALRLCQCLITAGAELPLKHRWPVTRGSKPKLICDTVVSNPNFNAERTAELNFTPAGNNWWANIDPHVLRIKVSRPLVTIGETCTVIAEDTFTMSLLNISLCISCARYLLHLVSWFLFVQLYICVYLASCLNSSIVSY